MTYEEIEARRDELERKANEEGYTEEILTEWKELLDAEMHLDMQNAFAIARNGKVTIFVRSMYECGYAIQAKINGEWEYSDGYTAVGAMKKFSELAREHNVKQCLVKPEWLDVKWLESVDKERADYEREQEYRDACMAESYGDPSLMASYNRRYHIEEEYSPSAPWNAPGMSVRDFCPEAVN